MHDLDKNWLGEEYYFDYDHEINHWHILERNSANDVYFNKLSTEEIATYFDNMTSNMFSKITLTVEGQYSTYSWESTLVCTGYTCNKRVSNISLDLSTFVF